LKGYRVRLRVVEEYDVALLAESAEDAKARAEVLKRLHTHRTIDDEQGEELGESALVPAAVVADFLGPVFDEVADAAFDLVADLPHLLERLAGGVVDLPVFDAAYDVGTAALAVERDRLVRMQLHLDFDLLRLPVGDVDAGLVHRLDDVLARSRSLVSWPADSARRSAGA